MIDIEVSHPRYAPGQVWTYRARANEATSRVTILRVDRHPVTGVNIVHVSIDGLAILNPSAPDGLTRTISHLPFAEDAVAASLLDVERTGQVPEFREGYQTWRTSFDQGRAGIWSVPIAEAISGMEAALGQKE